jgi:DNA processing protein
MAGGRVIGVLGTAIDQVFPKFNAPLFEDVAATGAIVSEYAPGTKGNGSFFPARNRIMAGLSTGVVVVEAPVRSGALITAHRALEYGRDVFAVPGNADSSNSRGSNALLQEGAKLVTNAAEVLCEYENLFPDKILQKEGSLTVPEEMAIPEDGRQREKRLAKEKAESDDTAGFFKLRVPVKRKKSEPDEEAPQTKLQEQLQGLSENQLKIVGAMSKPKMHIDDIIDLSQLSASVVLSELTLLQIKGIVEQDGGKRFTLNIAKRG